VNKILVFWRFCPRTATLYFWRWFCSLQLERARPSYMNWKIETFERFLVMQKSLVKIKHRKLVFVKDQSSVTRNIWTWHFIGIPRNSQLDHILSIMSFKKTRAAHCRSTVVVESKSVINYGCVWIKSRVRYKLSPVCYYRDKTRVHMFYFLNNLYMNTWTRTGWNLVLM